jgi:hypothetical protein
MLPRKPVILAFDCVDHDPIETWVPEDAAHVDFWMNFTIGEDVSAGDNFLAHIVTHGALKHLRGPENQKSLVVLGEYSWPAVLQAVDAILEQCRAHDWSGMTDRLRRHLSWEYEGMKG